MPGAPTAAGAGKASAQDPGFGPPTKADNQHLKAQARGKETAQRSAYEAGQRGETPGFFDTPEEEQAFAAGRDEKPPAKPSTGPPPESAPSRRSSGPPSSSAPPPGRSGSGFLARVGPQDPAGAVLALVAYAVAINFIRGGTPQVRQWFAAKFLNHAGPAASGTPAVTGPLVAGGSPLVPGTNVCNGSVCVGVGGPVVGAAAALPTAPSLAPVISGLLPVTGAH